MAKVAYNFCHSKQPVPSVHNVCTAHRMSWKNKSSVNEKTVLRVEILVGTQYVTQLKVQRC